MGILAPLALALLALALPIVVLYMLRLRRPPAPVSSLPGQNIRAIVSHRWVRPTTHGGWFCVPVGGTF